MAQVTFSIRMDESLKKEFEYLCDNFGLNMNAAINIFAKTVVRERKIPFEIKESRNNTNKQEALKVFEELRKQAQDNGLSDMSLEDINKEIELARKGD